MIDAREAIETYGRHDYDEMTEALKGYGKEVDIWSLGCIAAEILRLNDRFEVRYHFFLPWSVPFSPIIFLGFVLQREGLCVVCRWAQELSFRIPRTLQYPRSHRPRFRSSSAYGWFLPID